MRLAVVSDHGTVHLDGLFPPGTLVRVSRLSTGDILVALDDEPPVEPRCVEALPTRKRAALPVAGRKPG